MHFIQMVGPVDKRPLLYPLFKVADVLGRTLVITDDTCVLRFSEDFEKDFSVNRSDFYYRAIIESDVSELQKNLGVSFSGYDYVLVVSTNTVIMENDNIYGDQLVYVHGNKNAMCSEQTFNIISEGNFNEVVISINKAPKNHPKEVPYFVVDTKLYQYVWDCEEEGRFLPVRGNVGSFAGKLFSAGLGISESEFSSQGAREV